MNVVFIVTSYWAYGELLIAKEFAEDIKKNGSNVLFIIPPSHKNSLDKSYRHVCLIPNSRNINKIIMNEVCENFKPDIVVLSDFLNYSFADRHYGITREDLDVFRCPLATFDNFDWTLNRKCMDTYGFISNIPKKVNINDYGSRIIACPIGNPLIEEKYDEYRYSLVNSAGIRNAEEKNLLRRKNSDKYQIDKKIILVSNAKWQGTHIANEKIGEFIEISNLIFRKLLMKLAESYIVICIGEKSSGYESDKNIIFLESMPASEFEEYIAISDLYIGRNITSTSMIKIALSGVPCVIIHNSYSSLCNQDVSGLSALVKQDVSSIEGIYKFSMFPVGWYDFLAPVLQNNPYMEVVQCCELFEFDDTYEKIQNLLNNEVVRDEIALKTYNMNALLEQLMRPNEILEKMIYIR